MRLEQLFADRAAELRQARPDAVAGDLEEQLAGEAVAVGVEAERGQPEDHVARRDPRAVDDLRPVDDPDDEAGDVVLALGVEAGHLGRLAAEERAARLPAAARQPLDDLGDDLRLEPAGRDVVEEEERARPLDQDVVDAVRHQVVADRPVDSRGEGDLELGPDSVAAGDEDRLARAGEARR